MATAWNRNGRVSILFLSSLGMNVVLLAVGGYFYTTTRSRSGTTPTPILSTVKGFSALGRLEPRGGLVGVFAPPGDRVEKLKVKQGQEVQAGEEVALLASWADRNLEVQLAEAQLAEADEQLAAITKARSARLAEIDDQLAEVARGAAEDLKIQNIKTSVLERQAQQARRQQERLRSLRSAAVDISASELEQQDLLVRQTEGEYRASQAAVEKIKAATKRQDELAKTKQKSVETEYALNAKRIPSESLKKQVEVAKRRLAQTTLKAPVAGRVVKINSHEGDASGPQAILQIASGTDQVVVAEVVESDVVKLREWLARAGAVEVEFKIDALANARPGSAFPTLSGKLTRPEQIAGVIARNSLVSLSPRADIDRRVVEVWIELDHPIDQEGTRLIGMEGTVTFKEPGNG